MSLKLENGRILRFVDRTIAEMCSSYLNLSRLDMIQLCWMLKNIGIDYIEINGRVLDTLKKLPKGLEYLFRISKEEDFDKYIRFDIKNCVIDFKMASNIDLIKKLKDNHIKISLETGLENLFEDCNYNNLKNIESFKEVDCIRITNPVKLNPEKFKCLTQRIKDVLKVELDFCPENEFYNATAIAVETIMNGGEYLTLSFMGFGGIHGYAAMEEVLAAVKVLLNIGYDDNLKSLPAISKQFSQLTGIKIPNSKPVIGKGLFKFESGIHADGIKKNPLTYEPYEPNSVGLERELVIGKHSGSRSLMHRLKELGIHCKKEEADNILKIIREISIQNKRNLNDNEVIDTYINYSLRNMVV